MTNTIRNLYYKPYIYVMLVLSSFFASNTFAQSYDYEYEPSKNIQKLIKEQPSNINLILSTYKRYPAITEYYSQRQGFFAIEAVRGNPIIAIYSMEVFPGYFEALAKKVGGEEAIKFIYATSYHQKFLDEYSEKLEKYKDKPKLLGLLLRSHVNAKDHLITDLESTSSQLAFRLVEYFANASPAIRKAVIENPEAAFFLLETKEDGIAALREYGAVVAEIATFYQPGERRDVIRELNIGGKALVAAFEESSIVGWRTAIRFPKLYKSLVESVGIAKSLDFLNANSHYLASSTKDHTNPGWVFSVIEKVKELEREGIINYTYVDSFAFALCSEEEAGKELIARMGQYLPAALIYHYYPTQKAFLCKFLNRYGIAPLKVLYDYAKDEDKRNRLEKVMDRYASEGLLLVTYSERREEALELLLEDGFDRGKNYLQKFSFDEYGIPSYQGTKDYLPDLAKVTTNYFWYGTKPTWAEMGLAIWDAVDYLHMIYSFGSTKLVSGSGKLLFGHASEYVLVQVAKEEGQKYTLDKLKDIALSIAWKSFKKVLRKELVHQRFNQLEKLTVVTIGSRMTKNFVKTSWQYSYKLALNEFLTQVLE